MNEINNTEAGGLKLSDNPEYLYAWKESETPNIAIIYAVGGIVSGKSNPGPKGSSIMGDETIIKAFKDAYLNHKEVYNENKSPRPV